MLNLMAQPMKNLAASQQLKLYRGFLDLTQAQLAAALGTTQTSVARWESDITPISLMTMGHVRALVTARIAEATRRLFTDLIPKLTLSEFDGLFGNSDAGFSEDAMGGLYLGSVFIEGYRQHSLHMRMGDRIWCALDRDGKASKVDEAFLSHVISAGRSMKQKSTTE
jgi:transcriptional regulator with XRE-family HTH domain